ncbi:ExbD/TolR family protein [Pedobacter mucosus]|uniref:ExbD/TolR family protein n=1 Tax=Pedobacter mucosus TaxID=2895286 RepID=UPI001EE434D7|nr:biopolymer transporter ExbD [Pedobacter mucosus]UKT63374.1 biopolymer transporter ExbD [Pedobacter mucosus]
MASLNESSSSNAVKGRTNKATPRVDLTAMVDLMFLLTTFFMLTTSLSTLNAEEIAKPIKCEDCSFDFPASRTLTILLGKNNQAICYMGQVDKLKLKVLSMRNLQKEIAICKQLVAKTHIEPAKKALLVIIKPTNTSKYQDFVDVIDEMKIANIKSYAIDDENISLDEKTFLKAKGM